MTEQQKNKPVVIPNWIEVSEVDGCIHINDKRFKKSHELSPSASLIWRLCTDCISVDEIVAIIEEQFKGAEGVYADVTEAINDFREKKFIKFTDPDFEMQSCGRLLRKLDVPLSLQWHLEKLRQFWLGTISAQARPNIESNLDELLGEKALESAKLNDVDAAGHVGDSSTFDYSSITVTPEIEKIVDEIVAELQALISETTNPITISGGAVYLPGAHMGWHSNHSRSDYRIYCIWTEKQDTNYFRYQHPKTGKIITEVETPGWNVNYFHIPPEDQRLWHCIGAESLRFSLGFRF